ncbi:MAG: hypothetical protein AAGA81_25575 [Acidobacteriota bacterium]
MPALSTARFGPRLAVLLLPVACWGLAALSPAGAVQIGEAESRSLRLLEHAHLPLDPLLPLVESLALRRHSMPGLALAYYQPAILGTTKSRELEGTGLQTASLWLREDLVASPPGGSAGGALVVERPFYFELSVLDATPDVAEPLFYSLFMARLHQRYEREPLFAQGLRDVATGAFGEAAQPADDEDLAAEFIMASSAFASHLMTVANEIERAERRRHAQGRDGLCAQLRAGAGLFGQWQQAFDAPAFPVSTFSSDGVERTRDVGPEHRRWVVEVLLADSGWRGASEDHVHLCEAGR